MEYYFWIVALPPMHFLGQAIYKIVPGGGMNFTQKVYESEFPIPFPQGNAI